MLNNEYMTYSDLSHVSAGLYTSPESELLDLKAEKSFCQSGQLGNVGEVDPGQDEWFN